MVELRSRVGLGTAPLGSRPDGPLWWGPQERDASVATIRAAVDAGVDWVDTAPFYGWGLAEEIVGEALSGGLGAGVVVLTKCGTVRGADGSTQEDTSPASIRRGVDESRRRLGRDRLDVVQIHDPDPSTPIEESWAALLELVDDGAIGGAGLSNHPLELLDRALAVGPVTVVQQQYSLFHRVPERDGTIDWCREHRIPFLAWSPLASGLLTDGFDPDRTAPGDLRRNLRWLQGAQRARSTAIVGAATRVAERHGATLRQVALAWVLRRPGMHAIVGARSADEAAALADPDLADLVLLPELDDLPGDANLP